MQIPGICVLLPSLRYVSLKWTSVVESVWHDLQGNIKCFDPEALAVLELVLDIYNSDDL
jgi:hypothetical protein